MEAAGTEAGGGSEPAPGDSPGADDPGTAFGLDRADLLDLLERGDIEIQGRMPYSSNATLLVRVCDPDDPERNHLAVYKPGRGERPLWDFPSGLYKREVATYRLAEALGWEVVPPTAIATGPLGEGSLQAFVDADFSEHYLTLVAEDTGIDDLKRLCVLDLIANNTDRKSGHCLLGRDGRVYGIDHGLTFHTEFKLRTVIWDFVGEPVPAPILDAVARFVDAGPPDDLVHLLAPAEEAAMMRRAAGVVAATEFPEDDTGGHRWPWPLV